MNWIMERLEREIKKHKTSNPFEIAVNRNILINYFPLGGTLGFYMKNSRHQVITLNSDMNEHLTNFVCAHELGHAVLHPDENTPFLHKNTLFSKDKIEKQANYWATQLLLYESNLYSYQTKKEIMMEHGIPYEMERYI
ncbi:MAG: ImmA/IrrE family metallo-endopeptidase [Bacillus sp. (in: Bacteria)]|nr:ImmA/IrrE family metallo-endopeptidase [Bacillus sp. (in: firmicutes)]